MENDRNLIEVIKIKDEIQQKIIGTDNEPLFIDRKQNGVKLSDLKLV